MKSRRIFRTIRWILGSMLFFIPLTAYAAPRLDLIFVAPATTINTHFNTGAYTDGDIPAGYKAVAITAANAATFQAQAPPKIRHLYVQLQPGTTLRRRVDEVLQISGGKVDVKLYLVDDRTALSGSTGAMTPFTHNSHTYVWPAAAVYPHGGGSDRYDGRVGLGEVAGGLISSRPGGMLAWEATALHETSHTQFVGEWTKWGAINQRAITYGQDGSHYEEELLGDQAAALDEGQGTFFGHVHNQAERQEKIDFFKRADYRYFVEAQSVMAGQPQLYQVQGRQAGTVGSARVWRYRWRDIPGFYLLFSESTSSAFYTFFWKYVNNDQNQAFTMVTHTANAMWQTRMKRFLTYSCNRLALQMEAYAATPAGQRARTGGTLTSSMFPFALLDILTHFGMTENEYKADYNRNYPDRHPRAFAEYWRHRAAVQQRVQPYLNSSPIDIERAVREAHTYFQQNAMILTPTP